MTGTTSDARPTTPIRPIPYLLFAGLVVVYLAIIQLGGLLAQRIGDVDDDEQFTTTTGVFVTWSCR